MNAQFEPVASGDLKLELNKISLLKHIDEMAKTNYDQLVILILFLGYDKPTSKTQAIVTMKNWFREKKKQLESSQIDEKKFGAEGKNKKKKNKTIVHLTSNKVKKLVSELRSIDLSTLIGTVTQKTKRKKGQHNPGSCRESIFCSLT